MDAKHLERTTEALVAAGRTTISKNYAPKPVVMAKGEGMWVEDIDGRRYLDFLAGIAVDTLGHAHPALVEALQDQVAKLLHVSNAYFTEPQVRLQQLLVDHCFADRVYFCNSGAEANEAAIKLARRYQRVVAGTPRFEVITFERSFHGRTYAAISATAQPKYHAGFEPMVPGFVTATYGDLASVEAVMGAHTAAVLIEPVQGEGGIRAADAAFLQGLRALCDAEGVLLIADEVQCGVGRTGEWFGHAFAGVAPDIMALAKGIGGGVPLGAMVSTERVAEGFERGSHATTYGGNPLATRAGVAVFETIASEGLLERTTEVGAYFRAQAAALAHRFPQIVEVRGRGQMNGIVLDADAATAGNIVSAAFERGLLMNTAGGNVLRFVPPLICRAGDVDDAMSRLEDALAAVLEAG